MSKRNPYQNEVLHVAVMLNSENTDYKRQRVAAVIKQIILIGRHSHHCVPRFKDGWGNKYCDVYLLEGITRKNETRVQSQRCKVKMVQSASKQAAMVLI